MTIMDLTSFENYAARYPKFCKRFSGYVMHKDEKVARIEEDLVVNIISKSAPVYLIFGGSFSTWLKSRCIDTHRVNSRRLRKALLMRKTLLLVYMP